MFGSASAPLPLPLVWCGQEPWKDTEGGRSISFDVYFEGVGLSGHACQGYHCDLDIVLGYSAGPRGVGGLVIVLVFFLGASGHYTDYRDARVHLVNREMLERSCLAGNIFPKGIREEHLAGSVSYPRAFGPGHDPQVLRSSPELGPFSGKSGCPSALLELSLSLSPSI